MVPIMCVNVKRTVVNVPVRTTLMFGRPTASFRLYNLKVDTSIIACGVKVLF